MHNQPLEFKSNVILIDLDYVDSVAVHLRKYFRNKLDRTIAHVDLASWLIYVALDGGLTKGENVVQCIFLYKKDKLNIEGFTPAFLIKEMDGIAFLDPVLGEFQLNCLSIEEIASENFFFECVQVLMASREVKRLILVSDMEEGTSDFSSIIDKTTSEQHVTLLNMYPTEKISHVTLGYSLMRAMGIKGEEV